MHRLILAIVLACAVGCDNAPPVPREGNDDDITSRRDELAMLLDERLDAAFGERLSSIESSLEQLRLRLDLLVEELKSAQVQQDEIAAFEAEIKQALVDLGNVLRRAIAVQNPAPSGPEPRIRRP